MELILGIITLLGVIQPGTTASLVHQATQSVLNSNWALTASVLSGVVLVCLVLVLVGCLDICRRQPDFKEYNSDVFTTDVNTSPAVADFSMLPPVENTPDTANPIVFEPLPDPTTLRSNLQKENVSNTVQLRPKVAVVKRPRAESEESLDDALENDNSQLKLQNLLVSAFRSIFVRITVNSRHQVARSQLQFIKELGNGWFGKVLQGEGINILPGHKKTKVVIQMLKEDSDVGDQMAFLQEGSPFRDVDHPNVLHLLGHCIDSSPFLAVLELCPFGDVKTYLRSHRVAMESFNEKGLLLKFACDMAAGLQALHQHGYIHRDFAVRNCLLASDLTVKVGDYGISEEVFKEDYFFDSYGDGLPLRWLAPESVTTEGKNVVLRGMSPESNVWSFGVALWETLMFGGMPYADLSNDHVLRLVIQEKCLKLPKPDMPVTNLDKIFDLMLLCWQEPHQRPSLREIRIMLLHLLSNKINTDAIAFEAKWNQLMPRSPKVTKMAAPPPGSPISNGTLGFESNFVDLNSSNTGLAGSFENKDNDGFSPVEVYTPPPNKPSTPDNDLSLEAELKSQLKNEKSLNDELAELSGKAVTIPVNESSLADELNMFNAHDTSKSDIEDDSIQIISASPVKSTSNANTPAGMGSVELSKGDDSIDILSPGNDMFTSTPNKDKENTTDPFMTLSTNDTSAPSNSLYTTAFTSQTSTDSQNTDWDRSLEDERSFLGEKKFAAILQTVVTSFDGDDNDPLSSSVSSAPSFEDEEVFNPGEQQQYHRMGSDIIEQSIEELPEDDEEDEAEAIDLTLTGENDTQIVAQTPMPQSTVSDVQKAAMDQDDSLKQKAADVDALLMQTSTDEDSLLKKKSESDSVPEKSPLDTDSLLKDNGKSDFAETEDGAKGDFAKTDDKLSNDNNIGNDIFMDGDKKDVKTSDNVKSDNTDLFEINDGFVDDENGRSQSTKTESDQVQVIASNGATENMKADDPAS